MDERLRFVARLLNGEAMSDVCREFGISRKTGYKSFTRFKKHGLQASSDRCRRPVRYANQLPPQVENSIVTSSYIYQISAPANREAASWISRKMAK